MKKNCCMSVMNWVESNRAEYLSQILEKGEFIMVLRKRIEGNIFHCLEKEYTWEEDMTRKMVLLSWKKTCVERKIDKEKINIIVRKNLKRKTRELRPVINNSSTKEERELDLENEYEEQCHQQWRKQQQQWMQQQKKKIRAETTIRTIADLSPSLHWLG